MSDEEDDYMSDKFLRGSETYVAPSLIRRNADKRELELLKKKVEIETKLRERNKSLRTMEAEKREEGLSSAISSDNKGFEMLMKMGYKPGQGIGKMESGISEPIQMDVKNNREGLGKAAKKARKKETVEKMDKMSTDDFRSRIAQKRALQLTESDFHRSQKVCEQLDACNKVETPTEIWFWPPQEKTKGSEGDTDSEEDEATREEQEEKEKEEEEEEEEDEDEEESTKLSAEEKLEILTKYLRDKYFYCIWCGAQFDDEEDLKDNCPGGTRNDH